MTLNLNITLPSSLAFELRKPDPPSVFSATAVCDNDDAAFRSLECCECSGAWHSSASACLPEVDFARPQQIQEFASRPTGSPRHRIVALVGQIPAKGFEQTGRDLWAADVLLVGAKARRGGLLPRGSRGNSQDARLQLRQPNRHFVCRDIATTSESPVRLYLKKILHIQLSTNKQLQLAAKVQTEEIAHVMHVIPQDGVTTVTVKSHIEVAVTNIMSHMILKRRFMLVNSGKKHDEGELEQVSNFVKIMKDIAKYSQIINPGDFISVFKWMDFLGFKRKLQKLRERMDAFMSPIISEHVVQRKNGSIFVKDMVDVLLDQMEDETSQFDITNDNVNSTLWDAFAAGINTTIETIEWAIAECIRNPIVMKKVQAELDNVVGKSRRVEDADIPNLKYLQAIIKENFRLHLVFPVLVPHVSEKACKVWGYDIPEKTIVFVNVATIAQDPKRWEDPMTFKPERFLDGMPHAHIQVEGQNFELLPFGAGRRQCPGIMLGSTLVHIMVATFIQSFDWSLPNGLQPMDLDMSEAEGFGLVLAHPLTAIPKARLSIP